MKNPFDVRKKILIGYVPRKSSGWILEFLFKDLARSSCADDVEYHFCEDIISIYRLVLFRRDWKIFCMHPGFCKRLRLCGIPLRRISTFYTHTRLGVKLSLNSLRKLDSVFPMNSLEANVLINEGIPKSKVHVFPLGYSPSDFSYVPSGQALQVSRRFDVLFVGRFIDSSYYSERKNYSLIIGVVKCLLAQAPSTRIAFLGHGWDACKDLEGCGVAFLNCAYKDYPGVYQSSKLYVNLSRQEGGPISWLEAFASGCYVLSTPSGFPLELQSGELRSWVLPFGLECVQWSEKILLLLDEYRSIDDYMMSDRRAFLRRFGFDYLSHYLENTLFK